MCARCGHSHLWHRQSGQWGECEYEFTKTNYIGDYWYEFCHCDGFEPQEQEYEKPE